MSFLMRLLTRRLLFFSLILLLKGALAWFVVFDKGPSWMTLVTEVPFILVVFCLIEWLAKKRKLLYYMIANLLFTLLYFTVLMYYKYYGVIVTYHALKQVDKVGQVANSTITLLDPYYLLLFVDIVVLTAILWRPKNQRIRQAINMRSVKKPSLSVLFALSVALCIFNIWPNRASMNENKKAEEMGILNYEVYTIFADSTENDVMVDNEDITQSAIDELKGIQKPIATKYWGADKGKNVIIIQLESYQDFLVGLTIDGQEVTPNMNKLAKENIHFNHFYTMVGQGTTSDAEYVVNTSLYVPKHEAATAHYVEKALPSLPKLLHENGYTTATFHTNKVEFWNRTELYKAIGWDRYYDQTFFGDDDHIVFGASDEVLYSKTIDKLQEMDQSDQPFYAQIISMSAHHPFKIPESKYHMTLPTRFENTLVGDYIRAQNYADYALGEFISDLKTRGLWEDSIVLLYGDHQGLPIYSLKQDEKDLLKEIIGHEYGYTDMFKIPLILHAPGVTSPSVKEETGGQIDILPTVANLTGTPLQNQIHFGQDLLNQSSNLLPMRYYLPSGSLFTDKNLFLPGIAFEDGTNYLLTDNSETAIGTTKEQYNRALELLNLSDSYVTQLPEK